VLQPLINMASKITTVTSDLFIWFLPMFWCCSMQYAATADDGTQREEYTCRTSAHCSILLSYLE
jgi:hypothetical protein